jgi:hypothetical protein
VARVKGVFVGSGRTQRSEGGSDSVEGIGRSERRKSSLSDYIAVDEVLQLFGGLHGGAGPTLPKETLHPANELGFGRGGTARVGRGASACSNKDMREGPSGGENGGGKFVVISEEGIPQKGVEKVGDGHLPRKKEGPDETGKDVESQRGSFNRAGTVEVDDAETLDNKEKGVTP